MPKHLTTTLRVALLAAGLVTALAAWAACRSETRPTTETSRANSAGPQPVAQAQRLGAPRQAHTAAPEPTRAAMLENAIGNFADRITDITYLAAVGRIAETAPEDLPGHIAARANHDECLYAILQDARRLAAPERPLPAREHGYAGPDMAHSLAECFRQDSGDWAAADPYRRAEWIERIMAAATRAKNPAEHYRAIHPQAKDNDQWARMASAYEKCNALIIPYAESVAALPDTAAAGELRAAVRNVDHCMSAVTQQEWPDLPPGSPGPAPASTPGTSPSP